MPRVLAECVEKGAQCAGSTTKVIVTCQISPANIATRKALYHHVSASDKDCVVRCVTMPGLLVVDGDDDDYYGSGGVSAVVMWIKHNDEDCRMSSRPTSSSC